MKILQVTGFPNNGAGSGTLITTQAEDFVKHNHEVCTILSENRTDFPRVPGVKYHLIPFTAESESPEKSVSLKSTAPFNAFTSLLKASTSMINKSTNSSFDNIFFVLI